MTPNTKKPVHWAIRLNHQYRSGSFLLLFTAIGAHMASQGYGLPAWGLLTLQFLVYPQLVFWRARRARDPMRAELNNLVIDSLLFGIWAAALAFPVWITFTLVIGTTITHVLYLGIHGVWRSVAALAGGAVATVTITGLRLSPHTDGLATLLCVVALLLFLLAFAHLAYLRTSKLHDTHAKLRLREQTLHAANEALQRQFAEIQTLQAQLSEQANRDPLTGLYNRRYLDATLARELARCERERQPLSLMLIDVDHFKQVNDSYGHPAGDEVLKNLAAMLTEQARAADVVCRFGGEEFLLVLPNMPAHIALVRADQWRAAFAATTVLFDAFQMQTTLSIGIASYPGDSASAEELIRHADRALYRAKSEGRNRVMLFQTETIAATSRKDYGCE